MSTRALAQLWLAFAVLAAFGSLYPFAFVLRPPHPATLDAFWASCCGVPGRGDTLGNIVLFAPFGFLGMLAAKPDSATTVRFFFVLTMGGVLAFVLQIAQIWLPVRDENLQDVFWNLVGTALGAVSALAIRRFAHARDGAGGLPAPAVALICLFLAQRLLPFVPTIDFKVIKESLKPLLLDPVLDPIQIALAAVSWLVVAYLFRLGLRYADALFPVAMVVVFALEVVIDRNHVDASSVAGALIALVVWFGGVRRLSWQAPLLAGLVIAVLVARGLWPFALRAEPAVFYWLPFESILRGPIDFGSYVALGKCYLYGALVFLLWQSGVGRLAGTVIGLAVVGAIEVAQLYVLWHVPELTDPVMLAATVLILAMLTAAREARGTAERQAEQAQR